MEKLLFIINPKAGNGDLEKVWGEVEQTIRRHDIEYHHYFTTAQNDGCEQVKLFLKQGYRNIVVLGGDGTINEVVNGIFQQQDVPYEEVVMGLISMGTGNDWGRYYKWTTNHIDAIHQILDGNFIRQDIGVIKHWINGQQHTSYFANIAGFGFDAAVVKATNIMQARGRRKKSAYLLNLLKCLINNKLLEMKIEFDDQIIHDSIFSISIGNGKYSGGGMMQTPRAINNDGLLDIAIYRNIRKLKVISNVNRLYNGTIEKVRGLETYRSKSFKISCPHTTFAEIDGEIVGDGPYEISILPNALKVFAKPSLKI
ncbi:MAG: diacylglycerol kinase family lipid kinase [Bacteroidales bacterium]|nr:diacylglycerol kinase family lipid kinase [Bacteroidales bacterium]HOY38217.1 diacylglycerol kinase family lipid kinase [Bacteroidales bacterium]